MDRLQRAVITSVTDIKAKLCDVKASLLSIETYDEIRDKLAEAKSLKEVQRLLASYTVGDDATPPDVEDVPPHELRTKGGKLRAFKRSILLTLWEVETKLDSLVKAHSDGATPTKAQAIAAAKVVKSVKEELGLLTGAGGGSSSGGGGASSHTPSPSGSRRNTDATPPPSSPTRANSLGLNTSQGKPASLNSSASSGAAASSGAGGAAGALSPRLVRLDESDDMFIDPDALEFQKEIGQGAFGKVYKGVYQGQVVAIKTMKIKDKRTREAIQREVSLLKELRHPRIVSFLGLSKRKNNELLLVMEFIAGGELYEVICDQTTPMPWDTRINIAVDVASALAYLHGRNVIHRDIKSENLLVDKDFNVKMCDFGFARIAEDTAARMSMCGSFYFNAPELLLGNPYDQKVDVYSYGIFLCELITRGQVDMTRTADQQYTLDVAKLRSHIPPDCPTGLWKVAFSCCNHNPDKRPSSQKVYEFLAAVRIAEARKANGSAASPASSPSGDGAR